MLRIIPTLLIFSMLASAFFLSDPAETDWPEYNGDGSRNHFSPLTQINAGNLSRLKVAWTYASGGADTAKNRTQIQCNPIIIKGILYGVSAGTQAFAINAATGAEIWKTNVQDNKGTTSRGVSYWTDGKNETIFFGAGKYLYALDAKSGKPNPAFGIDGRINLLEGIQRPNADEYVLSNTPNTIYKNVIIVGTRVNENETALLGDIRAFDTWTGKLIWTFHTIPKKGEPGYETWTNGNPREHVGGANAWTGMAIDRSTGIVYIPTGSAAYDFYGGNRPGNNLYANCLLALDAATGKRKWHYQLVHHDIWDRDPPAPPNLITVLHNGKKTAAVSLITKQGQVFVFDRITGKPLFPIPEKSFSNTSAVPGEMPSPTQPVPTLPVPFTRQGFTENDLNPFVADRDSLISIIRKSHTGSPYLPIGLERTIFFPGTDGGAQWGGAAADQDGILYIPAKEIPVYTSLTKKETATGKSVDGSFLYLNYCSSCHGTDRAGNHDGSYPSLLAINSRMNPTQISQLLANGRGMMPSFAHISEGERKSIIEFLSDKQSSKTTLTDSDSEVPYQHTGYNRWYDSNGYPISKPPWGTLTAVDLNTGQRRWQIPLGHYPELSKKGIPPTGTDNYGGPLVTASGIIFIAASRDEMFRAIDKKTGKVLWETKLPAAGYASPSSYSVNGKQYIVIACGGGKLNTRSGDQFVAFALE